MRRTRRWLVRTGCGAVLASPFVLVAPGSAAAPTYRMPVGCGHTWHASTYAGHGHGVDLNGYPDDRGVPVVASAYGTATAHEHPVGGRYVIVEHGDGWSTYYGHLESVGFTNPVSAGEPIGTIGGTGAATAPHLHYEQRHQGEPQPVRFLGEPVAMGWSATPEAPVIDNPLCG